MRHQTRERAHVVLAVVQNVPLLLMGERRPLEDAIAHVLLVGDVDLVLTEIAKRTADAEETLFALAALDRAVVHVVAKFDVGIQRASGLAPTLRDVKAEFGGAEEAYDQRIGVEPIRRERAELVLPQANNRPDRISYATRQNGVIASPSLPPLALPWSGIVLGVDHPDFPERQVPPIMTDRHRRHSTISAARPPIGRAQIGMLRRRG